MLEIAGRLAAVAALAVVTQPGARAAGVVEAYADVPAGRIFYLDSGGRR